MLFAALLCAVALVISGDNPFTALTVMITQVGEGTTAVDIVNSAAVYYLAALAVAIGFQMKLFNIGIEGQYRLAACVAAIVGGAVALPPVLHTARDPAGRARSSVRRGPASPRCSRPTAGSARSSRRSC